MTTTMTNPRQEAADPTDRVASGRSTRGGVVVAVVGIGVLVLTVGLFLLRASDAGSENWPVTFDLSSSDNGVLFQLMQDIVAGRPLEWRFSPQIYFVPEIPISAAAFGLAGGNVYGYYLAVAVLNNLLLFGGFLLVARLIVRSGGWTRAALRAGAAMVPLIVAPLIGSSSILEYHLAATYYFGMYLAIVTAPALLLVRTWAPRILLGLLLALTAASNLLTLVFVLPGVLAVLLVLLIGRGWRQALRPGLVVLVALAVAVLGWVLFKPFQGASAFEYISMDKFAGRIAAIVTNVTAQESNRGAMIVLITGAVCAVVCALGAIVVAVRWWRRSDRDPAAFRQVGTVVFYGAVPLGGLAATAVALITNYLYLWPTLILPLALVMFALPRRVLLPGLLAVLLVGGAYGYTSTPTRGFSHADRYFGYRSPEMQCIDAAVPGGIGYATYSDARKLSVTSATGVELHQVLATTKPAFWLSNAAVRDRPGTFFFLNGSGDEAIIDPATLAAEFGFPNRVVSCSPTQDIWIYDSPTAQHAIAQFYAALGR